MIQSLEALKIKLLKNNIERRQLYLRLKIYFLFSASMYRSSVKYMNRGVNNKNNVQPLVG